MRVKPWVILIMALFLTQCAVPRSNVSSAADVATAKPLDRSSYLRVSGKRLVTADGRSVSLRGINLGGWLVTEGWMCGFIDSKDTLEANGSEGVVGRSTLESLEARFGARDAAALTRLWQDNWLTTGDLDRIRDGGFNLVRVPISYRTLQHADGSWILDARGQIDFSRMDWIVREAAARGIYTIFDLHVWPDQRTAYQKIGRPDGTAIRDAMARLWTTIAAHYRGNGGVAAFDLINEFPGNWGVQDVLARAVRKGDPDRVQVIEGFTFDEFVKRHAAGAFPNSVFSDHFYGEAPLATEAIEKRLMASAASPVPVYIGEFLAADFTAATQAMNRAGAAWSSWTYKTVDMGEWGVFNHAAILKTDIQNDSYQDIAAKWGAPLTAWQTPQHTPNYYINNHRLNEKG